MFVKSTLPEEPFLDAAVSGKAQLLEPDDVRRVLVVRHTAYLKERDECV